jgi:prohibitin 1
MRNLFKIVTVFFVIISLINCTVVREGEVGVKRTLGKYSDNPYTEGLKIYNPLLSTIVRVPIQTKNLEVSLNLPSKEGLNISAEISILYNVIASSSPDLLRTVGLRYEENVILPVFRSSIADVSARFYAKDMHTGQRSEIESAIQDKMSGLLEKKGISIEAVLFKSIQLPRNLAIAIEEKLQAEQKALRMVFVLREASSEAEKKRIDAAGVRDAQKIISEGLTPQILQFKSIEAFMELSKSPNTKIIVSDGDMPKLMLSMDGDDNN